MLHDLGEGTNDTYFRVVNPRGRHAIAAGVDAPTSPSRSTAMPAITAPA